MTLEEIDALALAQQENPSQRPAQRALADALTDLVHGAAAVAAAKRIAEALFSGSLNVLTEDDLASLALDGMDRTLVDEDLGLLDAMTRSGLAASNGAARKLIQSGGVSVNGERVENPARELLWGDALFGRYYLLRRGKKQWHLLEKGAG